MSFVEQEIQKFESQLAEIQRVESIRTSTAKRFTVSGSFIAAFEELTRKLEILRDIQIEETFSIFKEDIQSQIPLQITPQIPIEIPTQIPIEIPTQTTDNSLRNALIIGGVLLLL